MRRKKNKSLQFNNFEMPQSHDFDTLQPLAIRLINAATITTGVAYFCFLRRIAIPMTIKYVRFYVSNIAGVSVTSSEVGLFSSPNYPDGTAQTLTKLTSGTTDTIITTGAKKNSSSFDYDVAAGVFLWAGVCISAGTMPNMPGVKDYGIGTILNSTTGTFSGNSSFTTVLFTAADSRWPQLEATTF